MAIPTCIKCGNHFFEVREAGSHVRENNFKIFFVQCTQCGGVVGVQEYYNIGQRITDLAKKLNIHLD